MRKQRQALSVPQDVNTNTATQDHSSDTRQRVVRARGISAEWSACRVTPTQTQPRKPQRLLPSAAGSSLTLDIQNLNLYAQGITAGVILCKHSQNFRFGYPSPFQHSARKAPHPHRPLPASAAQGHGAWSTFGPRSRTGTCPPTPVVST